MNSVFGCQYKASLYLERVSQYFESCLNLLFSKLWLLELYVSYGTAHVDLGSTNYALRGDVLEY